MRNSLDSIVLNVSKTKSLKICFSLLSQSLPSNGLQRFSPIHGFLGNAKCGREEEDPGQKGKKDGMETSFFKRHGKVVG